MKFTIPLGIGLLIGLSTTAVVTAEPAAPAIGPVPNVLLVNQDNASFRLHSLKGKYVWVSFLYTHCPMPGACPLTVMMAKHLGRWWKQRIPWVPFHQVMITIDPTRDNPAELKKFAQKRGITFDNFTLATGRTEDIDALKKAFGVSGTATGDGNFFHDSQSYLLDKDLNLVRVFTENQWKPNDVICAVGIPLPGCPSALQAAY